MSYTKVVIEGRTENKSLIGFISKPQTVFETESSQKIAQQRPKKTPKVSPIQSKN